MANTPPQTNLPTSINGAETPSAEFIIAAPAAPAAPAVPAAPVAPLGVFPPVPPAPQIDDLYSEATDEEVDVDLDGSTGGPTHD